MVLIVGIGAVVLCFFVVALISRLGGPVETMDEIEARSEAARESAAIAADNRA